MRAVVLAGVLVLCACATPPARAKPSRVLAEGALGGGANPGFNPTTDAYNPNFDGPGSSHAPVFVIPWNRAAQTEQEQEAERERYIAMYRTYRMQHPERYVEHHIFPRALRTRFQDIGIDVDLYTILLEPVKHAQAHSGQEMYGPGGQWNWEWRHWWEETPRPSIVDAWKKAFEMIEEYGLGPHGPLCPYKCGRDIVHDRFDVSAAIRSPPQK